MRINSALGIMCIVLWLGWNSSPARAQASAQAAFDHANELLENKEFYNALKAYHQIEDSGYRSSFLYLNMGYTATQIDSLGLAKYYFIKTITYFPKDLQAKEQAEQALAFINTQFSRQSATLPKLPWDKALDWLKEVPGAYGIFWFGYVLILLSGFLLAGTWFGFVKLKRPYRIISIFAIAAVITILISYYVSYINLRYDDGVMIHEEIAVYQQPDESAPVESNAYEGYQLTIDNSRSDKYPDWNYIKLSNGQKGWIKKTEIKRL